MIHIKSNKLIIFDGSLSLKYDIQNTLKFCLKETTPELLISKFSSSSIVGNWFYNGRQLENPLRRRIDQWEEVISFEGFKEQVLTKILSVDFDFDKLSDLKFRLETTSNEEDKENFINLLNAINLYLYNHPDCKIIKESISISGFGKRKLDFFFSNLEQYLMKGEL